MRFRYSCVDCPNLEELEYIMEQNREIKHDTFRRKIGSENYHEIAHLSCGIPLSTDWSVSFHSSRLPDGRPVYYLTHSAIEYVFY